VTRAVAGMMGGMEHVRRSVAGSLVVAVLVLGALVGLAACDQSGSDATSSRQAEVEARGATVMPFDQTATIHVFDDTPTGGVQRVVAKDAGDARQIRLVRDHLRKEAARFAAGDFTDPMAIHGMRMPGLAALRRGASRVQVEYSSIPRGARIVYRTTEPELVTALHEWFEAQLMDHGSNAHG
jgi:hypothetical protein